jgi:hypothetical protein
MNRVDAYGLLGIADGAHKVLQDFNDAQNRFVAVRGGAFLQTEPAMTAVEQCLKQIQSDVNQLEETIPRLINSPATVADVESDFCQALGVYLCDLLNSMNAYLHFLRVHRATIPQFVLRRSWRRWQAKREFDRYEGRRMVSGSNLLMTYSIYNIAQQAAASYGRGPHRTAGTEKQLRVPDSLNPQVLRQEWAEEDKEFMDLLRDVTTPKTELARAYVAAASPEELLKLSSEPLCLATAEVFFTLNSPGPLNIVAAIQKRLTPNRYWTECKRTNGLFAECLLWVLDKFQEFCRHAKADVSAEQFDQLAVNAAVYWYRTNRYPEQEKKAFQEQLVDAIASRAGRDSDGADRLRRLAVDLGATKGLVQ